VDRDKKRDGDEVEIFVTKSVFLKSIGLALLFLAVWSCSQYKMATLLRTNNLRAYDGPVLPKDEVGYLSCATEARALEIAEIDGLAVKEIKDAAGYSGDLNFVELLPGMHTIKVVGRTNSAKAIPTSGVIWWTVSFEGQVVLEFSVEPGHVYLVDLEVKEKKGINTDSYQGSNRVISIFIRDGKSKMIVSKEVENKKEIKRF
jgi:hypothetical protein